MLLIMNTKKKMRKKGREEDENLVKNNMKMLIIHQTDMPRMRNRSMVIQMTIIKIGIFNNKIISIIKIKPLFHQPKIISNIHNISKDQQKKYKGSHIVIIFHNQKVKII